MTAKLEKSQLFSIFIKTSITYTKSFGDQWSHVVHESTIFGFRHYGIGFLPGLVMFENQILTQIRGT